MNIDVILSKGRVWNGFKYIPVSQAHTLTSTNRKSKQTTVVMCRCNKTKDHR